MVVVVGRRITIAIAGGKKERIGDRGDSIKRKLMLNWAVPVQKVGIH